VSGTSRRRLEIARIAMLVMGLAWCVPSFAASEEEFVPPRRQFEFDPNKPILSPVSDPLEGMNRFFYVFNARFDRYVFLPTVRGYRWITPDPVEHAVTHFFSNLSELKTFMNATLQLKPKAAGVTLGRFVVNSTLGLAGLFDPATRFGMMKRHEDFGQTLGRYHVGPGPYIVLPLLGPSNLRDTTGLAVDFTVKYEVDILRLNDPDDRALSAAVNLLEAIDTRKNIAFRYYETGTPFEYELVRYLYTKLREVQIAK